MIHDECVLRPQDRIPFETAVIKLQFIFNELNANRAWNLALQQSDPAKPQSVREQLAQFRKTQKDAQPHHKNKTDREER